MKHILVITKKELKRFFTDRRMLITLLLPGLMIYVLYSLMGNFMFDMVGGDDNLSYKVVLINEVNEFDRITIEEMNIQYEQFALEEAKDMLDTGFIHLVVVYEEDFYQKWQDGVKPNVSFLYNSTNTSSVLMYEIFSNYIASNLNTFDVTTEDYANMDDLSIQLITSIVPMLLIMFLFSGSMSISTESIAGEKERGTIATLLATPTKRSNISLGKIIALSIGALASATSSFIGLMLSLPSLFGGIGISFNMYGPLEFLLLFLVIVSTVLIFVVVISLISAYAKTIKEATSLATPLMILVMLVGVSSMIGIASTDTLLYLIPVYNSVQAITSVLSLQVNMINFVITIIANLVFVGLGIYLLTKMFNSEKIMFSK